MRSLKLLILLLLMVAGFVAYKEAKATASTTATPEQ